MLTWLIKQTVPPPMTGFDGLRAMIEFSECAHTGQKMSFLVSLYRADSEGLITPAQKTQMKSLLPDRPSSLTCSYDKLVDSVREGLLNPETAVHAAASDAVRLGFDKNPLVFASVCASVAVGLTDPRETKNAQRAVRSLFDIESSWGRREFMSLDYAHHVLEHHVKEGSDAEKTLALEAVVGLMPSTAEFNPLMWEALPTCLTSANPAVRGAAASVVPFLEQEDRARAKMLKLKELASGVVPQEGQDVPVATSPTRAMGALSPRLDMAKDWLDGALQHVGFVRRHPVRTLVGFMSPF